jgi:peptide/nickel transport system substrate-binding protein
MKRKIGWLMLSGLVILALVLASCGPAVEEEALEEEAVVEEEAETVTLTFEKDDGTTMQKVVEKPQYGGTFVLHRDTATLGFDDCFTADYGCTSTHLTNEALLKGDRSKYRGGTAEANPYVSAVLQWGYEVSNLATGWESPDPDTVILNIRPGVHFHDKPPTNGREMTAEDVAYCIERQFTIPESYMTASYGGWFVSAEATDKYTVVVKGNDDPKHGTALVVEYIVEMMRMFPKDAIEEFGDLRDWKNSIGTGPYILTDYVSGSSASYVRNPNYWANDPWFPENQLPYVDGVEVLIILDRATYLAGLRTGKVDRVLGITYEDAVSLTETNPEWNYAKALQYSPPGGITFRMDKPELPTSDLQVRRALMIAVNNESIAEDIYMGDAEMHAWPAAPEYGDVYTPFEELPEAIKEQYGYDPDKARQLLADAGYPDGFKCTVICIPQDEDILSMVQYYWAEIDVEVELDVKERAVRTSIARSFEHPDMITYHIGSLGAIYKNFEHKCEGALNQSVLCDDYLEERFTGIWAWDNMGNAEVINQLAREMTLRRLELANAFMPPRPYEYTFWTPWTKGYWGTKCMGMHNNYLWSHYLWIDEELKEEMGY